MIIEEGAEIASISADTIKNDLAFFAKSNQPTSQKIKNNIAQLKWTENIVQKIRNVGDDILDIMEKAGGHTLEKHVDQTNSDLTKRIAKSTIIKNASSFINKRIAIKAVKENLKYNATEIASWLITEPSLNQKKSFDFLHSYEIGKGIIKNIKNTPNNLIKSLSENSSHLKKPIRTS